MKILFVLTITFFILCCSSNSTSVDDDSDKIDMTKYYPLKIGNDWIYESDGPTEYVIFERLVVDTLKDQENNTVFKVKMGTVNFPPESFTFEYFVWDDEGLWQVACLSDSCYDESTNVFNVEYKVLLLKSKTAFDEKWGSRQYELEEIVDSKEYVYNESSIVYYDVAVIKRYFTDSETVSREYFAANIGFIGTDSTVKLIEYNLK